MKTSDLTIIALCYAVTKIEMPHLVWGKTIGLHHASRQIVVPDMPEPQCYSPFTTWEMCGPIIEREKISIEYWNYTHDNQHWRAVCNTNCKYSDVDGEFIEGSDSPHFATTPLIAAMRCYVASKLGDDIEIPEELQ